MRIEGNFFLDRFQANIAICPETEFVARDFSSYNLFGWNLFEDLVEGDASPGVDCLRYVVDDEEDNDWNENVRISESTTS